MRSQITEGSPLAGVVEAGRIRDSKKKKVELQAAVEALPAGMPRPEYPRPQLVRNNLRGSTGWINLNGLWSLTYDGYRQGLSRRWQDGPLPGSQPILVPFAFQWAASGVGRRAVEQVFWYERTLELPPEWHAAQTLGTHDVLLHFQAVDFRCVVFLNGVEVGHHQGGHVPFAFDLTPYLRKGPNRLQVYAEDYNDPRQPRGKQNAAGIAEAFDYNNTSGIWQTVWLELAPSERIESLRMTPLVGHDPAEDSLIVETLLHASAGGWRVSIEVFDDLLPATTGEPGEPSLVTKVESEALLAVARVRIPLPHARRWSPEDPHLYGMRVSLFDDEGQKRDEVISYTGIRSLGLKNGRFHLNGKPVYLKMVLDQGYWPESGMTGPTDEALRRDVELTKEYGYNGSRKHQKLEEPRWLYWCDRLGLLVWGEMANCRAWSPEAEEWFLTEWEAAVRRDYNHPCIVAWVPLNETWGLPSLKQFEHPGEYAFVERVVAVTRRLDSTRPVIDNDGWQHTDVADILTIHDYAKSGDELKRRFQERLEGGHLPQTAGLSGYGLFVRGARYRGQPIMLTEIGGFFTLPPGLTKDSNPDEWDELYDHYGVLEGEGILLRRYRDLMEGVAALPFVSGFCYTQLTDIEQEVNGILTFDRRPKVAPEDIRRVHDELFPPYE